MADVAVEAADGAVGVGAADVGGVAVVAAVAAVAVALDMLSSNVGAHEDSTCDDNLACRYPSSHFDVGGLWRGFRQGGLNHMLMKSVAARWEGELLSRR